MVARLPTGYIAQWLERLTADQQVPGSNPGVPSFLEQRGCRGRHAQTQAKAKAIAQERAERLRAQAALECGFVPLQGFWLVAGPFLHLAGLFGPKCMF